MAIPTIVFESSAATSGIGAISVARPAAGVGKSGDLELLFVESANETVATPSGFSILSGSPIGVGTAAATTATRLSIFYRFNAGETATISVADSGDHTLANLVVLRNVDQTTPFQAITTYSNATAGTSFSQTGLDVTTDIGSLAFAVVADQIDSTSSQGIVPTLTFNTSLSPTWTAKSYRSSSNNGGGITYRRAPIDDPATNHITGLTITSTGSISPCAICFYVRGMRGGPAPFILNYETVAATTTTSGADAQPDQSISIVAHTALTVGTTDISVPRAAGLATGDIELLFIEYPSGTLQVPNGWLHAPSSPVVHISTVSTKNTCLAVLWRLANGDSGNISITPPFDHVMAVHGYIKNAHEYPFTGLLPLGNTSLSGDIDAYNSIVSPSNSQIVDLPEGTEICLLPVIANSIDSTSVNRAGLGLYWFTSEYNSFVNQVDTDPIFDFQSSTGDGGGLRVQSSITTLVAGEDVLFSEYLLGANSSSGGFAALVLAVLGKKKPKIARASAAITCQIVTAVTASGSNSLQDTCPHVAATGPFQALSADPGSVTCPVTRPDGTTISSASEYNGMLDLLFIVYRHLNGTPAVSGWTALPTLQPYTDMAYSLIGFWRPHPDNDNSAVSVTGNSSEYYCRWICVEGAASEEPVAATAYQIGSTFGYTAIPSGGGNGYDASDWPYYGHLIFERNMNLVLGVVSYGEFSFYNDNPAEQFETAGPYTSLNTWNFDESEEQYRETSSQLPGIWSGKRYLNSVTSGFLDPARLGRAICPSMGKFIANRLYMAYWILIPSENPPVGFSCSIDLVSSVTATGVAAAQVIGQPAEFSLTTSTSASGVQGRSVAAPTITLTAQAVPLVKKGALRGSSLSLLHSVSAIVDVEFIEKSGIADVLVYESVTATFSSVSPASGEFVVSYGSFVQSGGLKGVFDDIAILQASGLDAWHKKAVNTSTALQLASSLDFLIGRSFSAAASISESTPVGCSGKKGAFGVFSNAHIHHVLSLGDIVTTFVYGDIVVLGLRARFDFGILDATRKDLALEVRRGIGADYERAADNLMVEVRRSLPEELFGSAAKLDGIEIVCVREVFNEGE